MNAFDHYTPQTLPEALRILQKTNGNSRLIAGGTDLMLHLKSNALRPQTVINIKRIPELRRLEFSPENGLRLGALTTLRELTRSAIIQQHYPALAYAADQMASEQIRAMATVGGNICNASPAADMPPPLIAHRAEAVLTSLHGERHVALEDFFVGPGKSVLESGELLQEFYLPPPQGAVVYLKQSPRASMDIAVVGAGVGVQWAENACQQARIVLAAVAPTPIRAHKAEAALIGQPLTDERIAEAAQIAAEECTPIDDVRASAWYRRRMVAVLVERALKTLTNNHGKIS